MGCSASTTATAMSMDDRAEALVQRYRTMTRRPCGPEALDSELPQEEALAVRRRLLRRSLSEPGLLSRHPRSLIHYRVLLVTEGAAASSDDDDEDDILREARAIRVITHQLDESCESTPSILRRSGGEDWTTTSSSFSSSFGEKRRVYFATGIAVYTELPHVPDTPQ